MAGLKEVRIRISSTISTQQITKAMKLVSATKLRKAQGGIMQMRPYADKLKSILVNLSSSIEDPSLAPYFESRDVKKVLLVVITSDRGLCGAFNSNILKRTNLLLDTKYQKQVKEGNVTLLPLGKKGFDFFRKKDIPMISEYWDLFQNLSSDKAFDIGQVILDKFRNNEYDVVEIVYNKFKNAATQIVSCEKFLPIDLEEMEASTKGGVKNDYIFEPNKVEILSELIPRSLKTQLYRTTLDSFASEHGSRMVSMDKATDNAGEILKKLKLQYNQARQAAITREISEIVGGAAALQG